MTDFLQLDFFSRARPGVRPKREIAMRYRDAGWGRKGEEIALFECPQCGRSSGWIACARVDWDKGPACPKCNGAKKR